MQHGDARHPDKIVELLPTDAEPFPFVVVLVFECGTVAVDFCRIVNEVGKVWVDIHDIQGKKGIPYGVSAWLWRQI